MTEEQGWYDNAEEEYVFSPFPDDEVEDEDEDEDEEIRISRYMSDFDFLAENYGPINGVDDHIRAIQLANAEWRREAIKAGVDPSPIFRM